MAIATGSSWRRDGVARYHVVPMPMDPGMKIYTPDDLMGGEAPVGKVVVYDDDHYYMGGVLAELLARNGGYRYAGYLEVAKRYLLQPKEPVLHPYNP